MKKLIDAIRGFFLMIRHLRKFDANVLKGKRVVVVGPASSAYNTGQGSYIDSFDFVVRINKSAMVVRDGKYKDDIGTRTDILFHSFFENEFSGGGPLDFSMYDRQGVRYVINPIPTYFGHRVTFNFYKKYLLSRVVYTLPAAPYRQIAQRFGQYRATTGFCALHALMNAEFSELFITGFTFFKTAYGDGYRDSLKSVAVNQKFIADAKIHNPDLEYDEFKVLLQENAHKRILIDHALKQILEQDGVTMPAGGVS